MFPVMLRYSSVCGSAAALLWILCMTQSSYYSVQRGIHLGQKLIVAPYWYTGNMSQISASPSAPAVGPSCSSAVPVQSD
uniref:Uncharacterized protein n=1 Tax=Anguilla anguilla TaxID=7936 RepID=A0A0E9X968_ANGAN